CHASSKASDSPMASSLMMPAKAAPPDQAASPKFSHSSLANKLTRIVWTILTKPGTVYLQSKGAALN
ncbi:hypothetical protein, partial [Paracoccus yeei]|uniref:hypothetical protein n=1 Tax=Paracoccus yeei TaxID=147645 RepID=UPI001E39B16A